MLDEAQGQVLLALARAAIAENFSLPAELPPRAPWLEQPGATFVTLTLDGRLRGCIGALEAYRPLYDDVRHNAMAAAFEDPRFPPLSRAEFEPVAIEVSLLSPAEELVFQDEQEALRQLRPGVDGLILQYGWQRATFLPQVWEQLPSPALFLAHLKNKAGLPADFWREGIRLFRYSVQKWHEHKGAH